ncbi:hypothetical protein Tco_0438206 [Tanacetum coccineum]
MASLDHRLNPLFSIKECMTCGALYTADFCCSKGGLEDKILVPKPPQNYATCGNPVDGLYCRSCAFVRKCLNEEPPDGEISLIIEPNATVINNFDELNEDECFDPGGEEIDVEDDDSFTFVIQTFLPFLTYPRIKPNFSEDSRVRWQQSGRSEGSRVSSQTLTSKHMDWFTAVSIGVPVRNALWFLQVRIKQESQENGPNRTNTDMRRKRVYKS